MPRVERVVTEEEAQQSSWIPEISEQRLAELRARIKPVIRFARKQNGLFPDRRGTPYHIQDVDPRKIAYTWDPKPTTRATGLKPLTDITTYHTWAYYGFFKPSIAEVLAQIPEDQVDKVVAFEIVASPETTEDLNRDRLALDAGYHVATTRLYTSAKR